MKKWSLTKALFTAGIVLMTLPILLYLFFSIPINASLQKNQINKVTGYQYNIPMSMSPVLHKLFNTDGDNNEETTSSGLVLKEDGKPLGPAHSLHAIISSAGAGAYSHWGTTLYFSSSDNTDPRNNNKIYTFSYNLKLRLGILFISIVTGFILIDVALVLKHLQHNPRQSSSSSMPSDQANTQNSTIISKKKPGPVKIISFIIISFFLTFVIGLGSMLLIELLVRSVYPVEKGMLLDVELFKYHPYLAHIHAAGQKLGKSKNIMEGLFGHDPETDTKDGYTCEFNSLGFRTIEFTKLPPKAPNEIRILLTGGSSSVSWNIGENGKLEVLAEAILKKKFPEKKFTFINLGNGAWISIQELFAVQLYGPELNPDFIVTYDLFNDAQHAVYSEINTPYCGYMRQGAQRMEKWAEGGVLDLFDSWKTPGYIRKLFHKQIVLNAAPSAVTDSAKKAPKYPEKATAPKPGSLWTKPMGNPLQIDEIMKRTDFDPYNQQVVDNYIKNITLMGKTAELTGAELIVVLQPALIFKSPLSDYEKKIIDFNYGGEANFIAMCYEKVWRNLNARSHNAPNCNIFPLDLRAPFTGISETIFSDNVHVSLQGNKIAASRLAAILAERLQSREALK